MGERQKYNLTEELMRYNETHADDPSLLGMSGLTMSGYNNSMRTVMFTSHLNQFVNLIDPEPAKWFTNMENLVGENSSGYNRVDGDVGVTDKVRKFSDDINPEYQIYKLFIYNKKKDEYDVVTRQPVENLGEVYGYTYNNDVIDSFGKGDTIKAGTVIYNSTSYDEDMNYGYGVNAVVQYTLDAGCSEDAAEMSEDFAQRLNSIEPEEFQFGLNNNDYLLNMYGTKKEYRTMPRIGEPIKNGIVAAYRRLYNNQVLHDFKDSALSEVMDGDQPIYGHGIVIDVEVFCNNPEIERNSFNAQVLDYLDVQTKYYKKINKVCRKIMASGSKYSHDIEYLFRRSEDMLNNNKWKDKDNNNAFGNLIIRVTTLNINGVHLGQKITFRFGNKSVISKVRPTSEMAYDENGRRVNIKLSLLSIVNRTTAGPIFELAVNFIMGRTVERMRTMGTLEEQASLLFEMINMLNEKQHDLMWKAYTNMSRKDQEDVIADALNGKIYINQPPLTEIIPIFYRLVNIRKKYDWLNPHKMYVDKWGRRYRCLNDTFLSEMLTIKLKQTSRKGFSARSTGAVNIKGLPERSSKYKSHMDVHSKTGIRFGEFENLNFLIGVVPEELALFNCMYRTSPKGRKDLKDAVLNPDKVNYIDKYYTSMVAVIFEVILKSLSLEYECIDKDNQLIGYEDSIKTFEIDDMTIMCTEYHFMLLQRMKVIEAEVFETVGLMDQGELDDKIITTMKATKYLQSEDDETELRRLLELIR